MIGCATSANAGSSQESSQQPRYFEPEPKPTKTKFAESKTKKAKKAAKPKQSKFKPQKHNLDKFILRPTLPPVTLQMAEEPTASMLPGQQEVKRICPSDPDHKTECFLSKKNELWWRCRDCLQPTGEYAGLPKLLGRDGEQASGFKRTRPAEQPSGPVVAAPNTPNPVGVHGKGRSLEELYQKLQKIEDNVAWIVDRIKGIESGNVAQ